MKALTLKVVLTLLFYLFCFWVKSQSIWTIGPMLHVNFGADKIRCSYNFEVAYWNHSAFPWSIDFALEFEKNKVRFYGEGQTGIGLAGISAGPVVEFQTIERKTKLGLQASVWGNYFWGFDLRYRKISGDSFFCPGTYLKTGFGGMDKNGDPIKHSSLSHWGD